MCTYLCRYVYIYASIITTCSWLNAVGQTHKPKDNVFIQSFLCETAHLIEELWGDTFAYGSFFNLDMMPPTSGYNEIVT